MIVKLVKKIWTLVMLALACAPLLAACGGGSIGGSDPDIRGTVEDLRLAGAAGSGGGAGNMMVVAQPGSGSAHDKASVDLTAQTVVIEQTGDVRAEVGPAALQVGDLVEVRFDGEVRDSYPVQATAAEVVIIR